MQPIRAADSGQCANEGGRVGLRVKGNILVECVFQRSALMSEFYMDMSRMYDKVVLVRCMIRWSWVGCMIRWFWKVI